MDQQRALGNLNQLGKSRVLLLAFFLNGCAYFENGATSKIRVDRKVGQNVYVNDQKLNDSTYEFEISNKGQYEIRIEREMETKEEAVAKSINPLFFQSAIAWPYLFVDHSLGSHLAIRNGSHYEVLDPGHGLADSCEKKARLGLKRSITNTWVFFMAGSAFALAEAEYAEEPRPRVALRIPLALGALGGLLGAGFSGYQTAGRTREIEGCIEKRINRQRIYTTSDATINR